MKHHHHAHTLSVSLILLSTVFSLLFLSKNEWLSYENVTRHLYHQHLNHKFYLLDYLHLNEEDACRQNQKTTVSYPLGQQNYRFHCKFHSLFLKPKPTKEKFITVDHIEQWLDLQTYAQQIYSVRSLSELPASSEQNPQIVITLNDIDERLIQDFYGIVITQHYLNFTDKKIYGTIYSTHPRNDPNRRNLSFKRQVIENLEAKYSHWQYLPHSRNTLSHNESH